ncbi:DUF2867 domain-containing protein [Hymenobacter rubripertinctus]|uniref:DUF2867 domain-containing protein n=1 Tax=Hymenobacter rubripertinctus TaxID=2029981 RepID=A0A418QWM7_9BACT|nr:DUF2867 domain-containing protein [Hymenobacter rubripertinctus]RIY09578.1 DUF2867 domain-containing protein [Hymenobacter rubripertinctus]
MSSLEEVRVPPQSALRATAQRAHYRDCYRMDVPTTDVTLDDAVRAFFHGAPAWVRQAMALRDRVMGRLGYHTQGPEPAQSLEGVRFEPGTTLGLFHIYERHERELIMGSDDRHLNFRVSILLDQEPTRTWLYITTTVELHNTMGRLYFGLIKRPHRLVVRSMMRNIRQALLAAPTA